MKKVIMFIPLVLFVIVAAFFFYALQVRKERPVSELASALIDRPFPEFQLQTLEGPEVDRSALVTGEVTLVNVWGSWCVACRDEHPFLKQLAGQGVRIVGVNYKDTPDMAKAWLDRFGNVAEFHIVDRDGRLGINLGVYGAPETYLIDADGFIRYKKVGIVDDREWEVMGPIYRRLVAAAEQGKPGA